MKRSHYKAIGVTCIGNLTLSLFQAQTTQPKDTTMTRTVVVGEI